MNATFPTVPGRAIWGQERVMSTFLDTNNAYDV